MALHEHLFDVQAASGASRPPTAATRSSTSPPASRSGSYVLVAPEPDRQQPHEDDEVYIVLEGRGTLQVEDDEIDLTEGQAMFVAARASTASPATSR